MLQKWITLSYVFEGFTLSASYHMMPMYGFNDKRVITLIVVDIFIHVVISDYYSYELIVVAT